MFDGAYWRILRLRLPATLSYVRLVRAFAFQSTVATICTNLRRQTGYYKSSGTRQCFVMYSVRARQVLATICAVKRT